MQSIGISAALVLALFLSFTVHAQRAEHRGITLYKEGKHAEAATLLELALNDKFFKTDPDLWNYLGLAYLEEGRYKAARKAFDKASELNASNANYLINLAYANLMMRETDRAQSATKAALKIDPSNPSAYYLSGTADLWEQELDDAKENADKALEVDPTFVQGYLLQADILVARLGKKLLKEDDQTVRDNIDILRQARDILRIGLQKTGGSPNRKLIENESAGMEAFYAFFAEDRPRPSATSDSSITPLKIIKKRPARYTDQARQAGVKGSIRMAILFGASGRVEHRLILKGLGYGLDQQALAAAGEIVFDPQKKDGKPLATVRIVEYTFSIY